MSYSCDCSRVYFVLDPVGTCSDSAINFNLPAPSDGIYKMKLSFLNEEINIEVTNVLFTGEDLTFPTHGLNEGYEWLAQIFKPDGDKYIYVDGAQKIFDCFSFKTIQTITI